PSGVAWPFSGGRHGVQASAGDIGSPDRRYGLAGDKTIKRKNNYVPLFDIKEKVPDASRRRGRLEEVYQEAIKHSTNHNPMLGMFFSWVSLMLGM
ncbi:unnamed protein product, partial [Ilex paraguariensis]